MIAQEQGDMRQARNKFKQAQKLDSKQNIIHWETQALARRAEKLIEQGNKLAVEGEIEAANLKFDEANKVPDNRRERYAISIATV